MMKQKMMETVNSRIAELDGFVKTSIEIVKQYYTMATGVRGGNTALFLLVKTAVARLKNRHPDEMHTKWDIEYAYEDYIRWFSQRLALIQMFEALFGVSVGVYRHKHSKKAVLSAVGEKR